MKLARASKCPHRNALHQGGDLWLVPDGAKLALGAATLSDFAARTALPMLIRAGHPLHRRRLLRNVPSGYPDLEVSATGEVVRVRVIERDGVAVVEDAEPAELEVEAEAVIQ